MSDANRWSWRWMSCALFLVSGCSDYVSAAHPPDGFPDLAVGVDGSTDDVPLAGTGLPCEVRDFLARHCASCHGATPAGGSPMSLATWSDLQAPSLIDGSKTMAEMSVVRMRNSTRPMPPAPAVVPEAELQIFEAWVAAGAASAKCDTEPPIDPFAGPPGCTSGTYWTGGNRESPRMHPGLACIDCHRREGPAFHVAGTVFPQGRDVDDCNGISTSAGVTVEVTDATGRLYRLTPNASGNFYLNRTSSNPFTFPYTARVIDSAGGVRAMVGPQQSGDCNGCHTSLGSEGAPGRIVPPM